MWVKICGVGNVHSARAVAAAAADAVGLNFYAQSPRHVAPETARKIVRELPESISPVGLFVNHSPEDVADVCRTVGLRHVQLHGDETPEMLAELHRLMPELRIIRAFRVSDDGLATVADFLRECASFNVPLFASLIDACEPGTYGGTGQTAPWKLIRSEYRFDDWPPLILAGGLTPQNVADAIRSVQPWGVDVAGGVESSPGVKDAVAVKSFVELARGR